MTNCGNFFTCGYNHIPKEEKKPKPVINPVLEEDTEDNDE